MFRKRVLQILRSLKSDIAYAKTYPAQGPTAAQIVTGNVAERVMLQLATSDLNAAGLVSAAKNPLTDFRICCKEEVVTLTAAAYKDTNITLPAGAIPIFFSLNFETAITLAGTAVVKIGVGSSGNEDLFFLTSTTMTKNTKEGGQSLTAAASATAITVRLTATDTNGAVVAGGTPSLFAAGEKIRIRVIYMRVDVLPDAA